MTRHTHTHTNPEVRNGCLSRGALSKDVVCPGWRVEACVVNAHQHLVHTQVVTEHHKNPAWHHSLPNNKMNAQYRVRKIRIGIKRTQKEKKERN